MATDTHHHETDVEEEIREVNESTALDVLNRSEIDVQIATAKRYPRNITRFKREALQMATLDEETAGSMFYVLPRAGKKIEGPSIRMAEVVGTCYGNLRYGARIVSTDDKFITAQGACHDLEKNIAINYEVRRRITNKNGDRYNDDMIQTTGNAAMSIALREAIFRVVPRALFMEIYKESRLCSVGKASTMSERRHKAFDWFKKAGATEMQLLAFLGRAGIDDVSVEDLITLRGLVTAIKDGEITIETALKVDGSEGAKVQPSAVADKLKPKKPPAEPGPQRTTDESQDSPPEEINQEPPADVLEDLDGELSGCHSREDIANLVNSYGPLSDLQRQVADKAVRTRIAQIEGKGGKNQKTL